MTDNLYLWLKALHIISFTAWMAGMFYLPRLFVYHAMAPKGGEMDITLQVMERKLLRLIINPAMILTFIFGIWLIVVNQQASDGSFFKTAGWLHSKLGLLLILTAFHGMCARWRKRFANGTNTHSDRFYRWANEVPTVLLVAIVLLAVLKPF